MSSNEKRWLNEMDLDPEEYVVVCWPDSQMLMDETDESKAAMSEASLINDTLGLDLFGSSAYVLPREALNKLGGRE